MAKWNNSLIRVGLAAVHKIQGAWLDPRQGGGDLYV